MLSDTDIVCVDIYWGCVKRKGIIAGPKHGTNEDHNTHTHKHKSYDRPNAACAKQQQEFIVVARSNTWSAAQDCSPTVATTNTNSKK